MPEVEGQQTTLPDPQELIDALSRGDNAAAEAIRAKARAALPGAMEKAAMDELDRSTREKENK